MILVHTSDLHLGSALTARLDGEKLRQRRSELIDSFINATEEAVLLGARLFIIAGDLFDTTKVTAGIKKEVLSIIRRVPDIDFLYLPGNHERLSLLDGAPDLPENLKVFGEEWTYFKYGFITVAGKSSLGRNLFDGLMLDRESKNIVVLHGALSDRSGDETIGKRDAIGKNIDYLALGHYHAFQKEQIDERTLAVYSGTPEGRGFDEVGECGIAVIDTDGAHLSVRFLPIAKRQHLIKTVDISDCQTRIDVDTLVKSALFDIDSRNLVRIVLTGKHIPELTPDTESLKNRYGSNFYHLEVIDESGISINSDDYKYDRSLKGEFIRLVHSKEELSEKERERIIKTGLGALLGDISDI